MKSVLHTASVRVDSTILPSNRHPLYSNVAPTPPLAQQVTHTFITSKVETFIRSNSRSETVIRSNSKLLLPTVRAPAEAVSEQTCFQPLNPLTRVSG